MSSPRRNPRSVGDRDRSSKRLARSKGEGTSNPPAAQKKAKRSSKATQIKTPGLKSKEKQLAQSWSKLDKLLVTVFNDLRLKFHPYRYADDEDAPRVPHDFTEYEDFPAMSHLTRPKVKAFGDKLMLRLMPKILEAKAMASDFDAYTQNVGRFERRRLRPPKRAKRRSPKNTFFIAMKKYKKVSDYEHDESGPICGVFRERRHFAEWKRSRKTAERYGTGIKMVKFEQNDDGDGDLGADSRRNGCGRISRSEHEAADEKAPEDPLSDDELGDLSPEFKESLSEDDGLESSVLHGIEAMKEIASITVRDDDDGAMDEETQSEDAADGGADGDIPRRVGLSKSTRSRRSKNNGKEKKGGNERVSGKKRKRDRHHEEAADSNPKKKAKLNAPAMDSE